MTEDSEKRSILVTSALPYANAPLHLGHILEHIQTDIWVRYQRLIGNDAVYVCADDAHGTPIMLKADELNITPEELIADVYKSHTSVFKQFNISHDNYHSTHSEENESLSQQIFLALQNKGLIEKKEIDQLYDTSKEMFLSDRYVKGTCPSCGAEDQYGDNCEKCSATYNAIELKNPISVLSNTAPIVKKSEHLFFKLSALKEEISSWLDTSYIQSTVRNKLNEWLNDDLKDWDISRDSPYFGFKIPGYEEKYFYVWLDAPIGYLASHLNYLKKNKSEELFNEFWNPESNSEVYHFIGKDIMYFHALFFPVMLSNADFKTPDGVFVHGFLTLNGEKMSKSRGNFISAESYLDALPPDYLRYYFASKLGTGVDDIDLSVDDFMQKNNSDLVNKYINLASRSANFIEKYFDGKLSETLDSQELVQEFKDKSSEVYDLYERMELSKAMKEIMLLADKANQYFDAKKPWVQIKDEASLEEVHSVCTTTLNLFKIITVLISPVLPEFTKSVYKFMKLKDPVWSDIQNDLVDTEINKFESIITRIDDNHINKMMES
jgi:methionyl-tRNA synthetase